MSRQADLSTPPRALQILNIQSFLSHPRQLSRAPVVVHAARCMSSSRSSGRSITSSRSSATSKSGAVNRLTTSVSGQSERQKTLNKFLGLPLEHYQIKVDSLFRKQERLSRESVSSRDLHTVSIAGAAAARSRNHSKDIMEISSDVEDNGALKQSKANGTQ